jgi:hypothetical protein
LDLDNTIPLPKVEEANAMSECFNIYGTEFPSEYYPLHMSTIARYQKKDAALLWYRLALYPCLCWS